ncbi:hypothetical protein Droror1_Dr00026181 [Drosera rotundifolia]
MWQVAVAAAVAGSGLLAKRLFAGDPAATSASAEAQCPATDHPRVDKSNSSSIDSPQIQSSSHYETLVGNLVGVNGSGSDEPDGIFRFSSSGSGGGHRSRIGSKKEGVLVGKNVGVKVKKKGLGGVEGGNGGKWVCVCLKKRRTGKGASCGKRSSCCCKEGSSFNWGLGLGIMCMISAGKAEISKLNNALDETTKVVEEMKGELCKRKSSIHQQPSALLPHDGPNSDEARNKKTMEQPNTDSSKVNKSPFNMKIATPIDECEYASSVLTEEPPPHSSEMDLLEAELESELEKLPWGITEVSCDGANKTKSVEVKQYNNLKQESSMSQFGGVPPFVLSQKLSRVLIEQQESQISELESELNSAYSKLQEKEVELLALKGCVERLTVMSLNSTSDEVKESCREQGSTKELDQAESKGLAGTKRAMNFGPFNYSL